MSESESTPAPLGASDAPILTENGSREAEYALFNPGSDVGVGSDAGVAAHTHHRVHLRTAAGARPDTLDHADVPMGIASHGRAAVPTDDCSDALFPHQGFF